MKYKKGDQVRYINSSETGLLEYGKAYEVQEVKAERIWVKDCNDNLIGVISNRFEPAELGEKKMNRDLDNGDKLVLTMLVSKEYSDLQNSLSDCNGKQRSDRLMSMLRMAELLAKLGE